MERSVFLNYINETENIRITNENDSLDLNNINIFSCFLRVDNNEVPIKIMVSSDFPEILPKFFLDSYDTLGFLPHIEPDGSICFLEKESIYINVEKPKVVFQASVDLVIKTIYDGIKGKNKEDFREEFHVFWERNKYLNKLLAISLIDIYDTPKKIQLIKNNDKAILFDSNKNVERLKSIFFKNSATFPKTGIYIPLEKDCDLIPPKYDQKWLIDDLMEWLKPKISDFNWKKLTDDILNKRPERFEYLVLAVPRNSGPTILVGIQLKPKKGTSHPLLKEQTGWGANLLKISRLDIAAILPRGGSNVKLQSKRVLLIGCGSVGSHIAMLLTKTGLGYLELVDHDKFKIENVQRFSIGLEYIGKNKVEALKEYLEKNFIGTKISAKPKTFKNYLRTENVDLTSYDLIISATGDPTVNLSLNKKLKDMEIPFIISWNEPYGIGGHSLLSVNSQKGCYKCLFRETYNIASFSDSIQTKPFHKKHLGCGEVFTPYSAIDSIRTSELVIRLAIGFLIGSTKKSQIISWIGDSTDFIKEGYNLSTRFTNQTQDEMHNNRYNFINEQCTHCGK